MSAINNLIASNCKRFYDEGFKRGVIAEHERLTAVAGEVSLSNEIGEYVYLADLWETLEEEGNK